MISKASWPAAAGVTEALTGHSHCGRREPVPAAPNRERSEHLQSQSDHAGVKFLLRVTLEPHDLTSEVYRIKELPSGSRGPVDISVRQQRRLAFIHRPRKNDLNGRNQSA